MDIAKKTEKHTFPEIHSTIFEYHGDQAIWHNGTLMTLRGFPYAPNLWMVRISGVDHLVVDVPPHSRHLPETCYQDRLIRGLGYQARQEKLMKEAAKTEAKNWADNALDAMDRLRRELALKAEQFGSGKSTEVVSKEAPQKPNEERVDFSQHQQLKLELEAAKRQIIALQAEKAESERKRVEATRQYEESEKKRLQAEDALKAAERKHKDEVEYWKKNYEPGERTMSDEDVQTWLKVRFQNNITAFAESVSWEAAGQGRLDVLKWVKRCRFQMHKKAMESPIILLRAAAGGHLHVLQWLVNEGASLNYHCESNEYMRLDEVVAIANQVHVLDWLFEGGEKRFDFWHSIPNYSPAHRAAANASTQAFTWLIHNQVVSVHVKTRRGDNLAHEASESGSVEILQFIEDGFNFNFAAKNHDSYSCVHYAASNGHTRVLDWLERRLSIDFFSAPNKHGDTPLYLASERGHQPVVDWLKQRNILR